MINFEDKCPNFTSNIVKAMHIDVPIVKHYYTHPLRDWTWDWG